MLLGKRARPPMKRTTSITEFTLDLSYMETPISPSDPRNPVQDRVKSTSHDGFFNSLSPRNPRRNSSDFVETAHFLRACGLCERRLTSGRDIYMYRGDTAFCSSECRQQQMIQDERKEKCVMLSNKETTTPGVVESETSRKNGTVVAA
ncbi:hypothetical protein GIB67_026040 [Kingdonia uniflora]|uniref:FLZ-type domain-containing protein n=1 Tax=Kingdonia uniflora TaxID=39325 RepID=A0A7J7M328_9MAGN|nr:hypothetical protein GIB67_026040 [Kingdonia uniflora]